MSENDNIEEKVTGSSSENVEVEVSETHTLTQKVVNGQIERFTALLIRQLEEWILLVQGMVTTPHLSHYPRADFGTTSATVTQQSDNFQDLCWRISSLNLNVLILDGLQTPPKLLFLTIFLESIICSCQKLYF